MKRRLLYLLVLLMAMVTGMRAQAPSLSTPLTIEATTEGTIIVTDPKEGMKYSLNDGVKNTMSGNIEINVAAGDKVQLYGDGTNITKYYGTCITDGTARCIAYGNIMSLVDEENYVTATTLQTYAFTGLFTGNTTLTDASGLLLPATTLAERCYFAMFLNCTALVKAPALPATTLVDFCYNNMFNGCTSLSSVVCLATDISATDCTVDWVDGVAAEGIFTAADKTVAWKADNTEGIPSGWTRENVVAVINDETNFPDEIFRTYLLNQDYGTDGLLTDAEVAEVKKISVSSKDVESLKGIELFTALTSLDCGFNKITSLDVSKNTELTMLDCSFNALTSIDVSKNTALTGLYCFDNQLTSLDVSKNTALTYLGCYDNQLTSIDVSKNTALTGLYCFDNQLTSLDVSKNTALTMLYCDGNQLTSLDVSKNTALTGLFCYDNQLSSLDVSTNTALTDLFCHGNQLTSLDVSKNTLLEYLEIDRNQIKGAAMDALVESLPVISSDNGMLRVIYNENEQNEMTAEQVAAAKAKGWIPKTYDGFMWVEYTAPTAIYEVKASGTADGKSFKDGKFFRDGKLFIKKNGKLYEASGAQVK